MAASGKVALVTGSGTVGGIGYGIAKALAKSGYDIILNSRQNDHDVEPLREQLHSEFQVKVHYIKADLLQRSEIENLCKKIETLYPSGLDILVNNAGISVQAPLASFPGETWDDIMQINLTAPFDLIRLTLDGMKTKGWGRIINIGSIYSKIGYPTSVAYICSKHGIDGLTKTVALDTLGTGVTCNTVCPAMVKTNLITTSITKRAKMEGITFEECETNMLRDRNPSGSYVTVEQVGELVAFLCSPAADQMTGAAIPIDAGCLAK